jgi:hypothetical protein
MNDQNPNLHTVSTPPAKPSLKDRVLRRDASTGDSVKTPSSTKDKVKTGLAVVGTITVAAFAVSTYAKRKGVKSVSVTGTVPDLDVTTDAS